jgi:chromosome segregation ATPase
MHIFSRAVFLSLVLCITTAVHAQSESAQLREAIAALNTEQQSVYQQFQMLQSMRTQTLAALNLPPQPGPPGDYDEIARQRQANSDQLQRYQNDMDALYTRYRELDAQKQPLLARLRELALQPPAAAAPARTTPLPARPAAPSSR